MQYVSMKGNGAKEGGEAMAATATLNVRLPEDLKDRGAQVLRREGVSVSDAVRGLYEYMEKEQRLPEFIKPANEDAPSLGGGAETIDFARHGRSPVAIALHRSSGRVARAS